MAGRRENTGGPDALQTSQGVPDFLNVSCGVYMVESGGDVSVRGNDECVAPGNMHH